MIFSVPVEVKIGTTYMGHVDTDGRRFFEIPITEEGLTIDIQVETGKLLMYGAQKNPNPNKAKFDKMMSIEMGETKAALVHYKEKRGGIYYCNLFVKEACRFTLKVEKGH